MHEICNKPKAMFSDEINHSHKKQEKNRWIQEKEKKIKWNIMLQQYQKSNPNNIKHE